MFEQFFFSNKPNARNYWQKNIVTWIPFTRMVYPVSNLNHTLINIFDVQLIYIVFIGDQGQVFQPHSHLACILERRQEGIVLWLQLQCLSDIMTTSGHCQKIVTGR